MTMPRTMPAGSPGGAPMLGEAAGAAERLLGRPVRAVASAGAGANSRIFRVETPQGAVALKSYPEHPGDSRPRAEIEWQALRFLRDRGLSCVPEPIARDRSGRFLAMEWIAGTPISAHAGCDIAHAAEFVSRIFALSADPAAIRFPLASEACLSAAEIVAQIERRRRQLAGLPALLAFLDRDFTPALDAARELLDREVSDGHALDPVSRRLIPADFGFHNALREPGGALRYIDFDYFGWDDPVKLTADFLLHPAMRLDAEDRRRFVSRIEAGLPDDADFLARLRRHLPLYALRWALILLNPFRPERAAALPAEEGELRELLTGRIAKARAMVSHPARAWLA